MVDIPQLRELAEKVEAGSAHGPWEWHGGYPQTISAVGTAAEVAQVFENPDLPGEVAPYIAACDPRTVLGLLARLERAEQEGTRFFANHCAVSAELAAVARERDEAVAGLEHTAKEILAIRDTLEQINRESGVGLVRYAKHLHGCAATRTNGGLNAPGKCDCGLNDQLARLAGLHHSKEENREP